jgi:hypothetical protein
MPKQPTSVFNQIGVALIFSPLLWIAARCIAQVLS